MATGDSPKIIKIHGGQVLPDGRTVASFMWPAEALGNLPVGCEVEIRPVPISPNRDSTDGKRT